MGDDDNVDDTEENIYGIVDDKDEKYNDLIF